MIEVFADVCCPFTHVGLRRLVAARRARGVTARLWVRAWPLELVNGAPLDSELVTREIAALREQVGPELFVGFDPARFPSTSIPALGLTTAAYEVGAERGELVALLLRDRLFEQGDDISEPSVLSDVAAQARIAEPDPVTALAVVRRELEEGRRRGVEGSPHFFTGRGPGVFCPSLRISREGDAFSIEEDPAASKRLLDAVLADPDAR